MAATYEPIATTTLGSAASSITFSSIPNTYTDLKLVLTGIQSTSGRDIKAIFNSDTGSNYSWTALTGDNVNGVSSSSNTNASSLFLSAYAYTKSTNPILLISNIFSYVNSAYKTVLSEMSADNNGSGEVTRNVGLWRSTSAITQIDLSISGAGATFSTGTTATLYGIKAA